MKTRLPDIDKQCHYCGKPFSVRPWFDRVRYCSRPCYRRGHYATDVTNWTCAYCGAKKHLPPFKAARQRYCGLPCRNAAYSVLRRGEGGTNWKGGLTQLARRIRTSKTMRAWAEAVLASNGGQCATCDSPATDAHHIVSVAELLAKMVDLANGIPLCQSCHGLQPDHNSNLVRRPRQAAAAKAAPSQIVS